MVKMHAIKEHDIEMDEESDVVTLAITDGDGEVFRSRLGVFVRTEDDKQNAARMGGMLERADYLRRHFMEHGELPASRERLCPLIL